MQINTYTVGFELTPSLRGFVESRLSEALRSFAPHIQSAVVTSQRGQAAKPAEQVAKSSSAFAGPRERLISRECICPGRPRR